ncbi:LEAF RUST 10 DISEASE-RESISTANCE LOCUS RECEPTOR-LIKE PROTEIN KINASE-like 1.1 isoform X2 [Arachis duranensis]|uniref:LEAF RUST 10 DISEASE-RESISTANCE LOCUS RECEPTOR-LIKE PROTEIN KINASE-like 1.1 isoform X2 n=1 Tax=Arachis duranensis TaxID=130453 RepID=A0A6P5NLX4_ARADU|nr:LEAF RUST 10 DISEASE-RESISTANCE LOCUS RECEPTOR-LIKE PROTEIN KINASE-like 1.1 isoform X2 [Arachis duranensis]
MRLRCDLLQCCFTGTSSNGVIQIKGKIFPYLILAQATNNFNKRNCLGKIGLKNLYYGKLRDGCEIVIERVSSNDKRQIFQQFLNEILVSNILDHKNLVTFRGYAFHHEEFLVAHEYLSNGTLAAYLECEIQHNKCTLPLLTRMEIAIDIANALSYLHKHGIIHHNINSSNILLDKNMCAKVAGLHLSRKLPEDVSVNATSIVSISSGIAKNCVYIDPEYVSHGRVSTKNDVYSFGVVLCDLISSKLAKYWEGCDRESIAALLGRNIENQALDKVLDPRTGFQSDHKIMQVMTAMAELALNCMGFPQEQRPNMEQVLDILNGKRLERYKTIEAFRIFDYADLRKATMQFHPDRILGEGGFGSVFYGKLQDGLEVAIKRFHNMRENSLKQFMNEIEILRLLHHRNLVSLYGRSSGEHNELFLVYEYVPNGTVSRHIHGVADFGLSRSQPDYVTHVSTAPAGTNAYMDPEYFQTGRVSYRSDVYSFGVVLFELISSKPAFWRDVPHGEAVGLAKFAIIKLLNNTLKELVDPDIGYDSDKDVTEMVAAVAELAFQCIQCPKELRPSMKQVLETLEGIKKGTWGFNQIT